MSNLIHVMGDRSVLNSYVDSNPKRKGAAIINCSGANRNAFVAGALAPLRRRNWHLKAHSFCGVSSGIANMFQYIGSGTLTNARMYSYDTNNRRLLNFSRKFIERKHPLDIDFLDRLHRGETGRGIPAENVMRNNIPCYAILSNPQTGETLVFKPETPEEVYQLAVYGSAIAGLSRRVYFRGQEVSDGYYTRDNFPVDFIMSQPNPPTDILVFAARHYNPNPQQVSAVGNMIHKLIANKVSDKVLSLIRNRNVRFVKAAHTALKRTDVRVLIVWNSEKTPDFHISTRRSRKLIYSGYQTMKELLEERGL